jgi:dTDP-4-dehydrorhamnose reductase
VALRTLQQLRDAGLRAQMHAATADGLGSFKSQFKKADASGAAHALVFGADELARGEVTVKSLRDGKVNLKDSYAKITKGHKLDRSYVMSDYLAATITGVDATDYDSIARAIAEVKPEVVINCIGIIKQLKAAKDPIISLSINSLFPHRLAILCRAAATRMIHISTDCVFSGRKGMYTEDDVSDAEDLYGRTKYLGEVGYPGCLTIRTSIIGRELHSASGLVDWFLSNRGGKVRGFRRAMYTGFTTVALAKIIAELIRNHPELSGLWQVSSEPITKFDLLKLVNDIYRAGIEIEPDDVFFCDRSLNSARFRAAVNFQPSSWAEMISEMYHDPLPYDQWRKQ